jgi:GNAT superfamily N-acetyltransferase
VETYPDGAALLRNVSAGLEENEAENSLLLGVARALPLAPAPDGPTPFFASVRGADWVVAALMTPPFPVVLAGSPGTPPGAAAAIAARLAVEERAVSGVNAAPALADAFASEWEGRGRGTRRDSMQQRIYRLRRVCDVPLREGSLRRATVEDADVIEAWTGAFLQEAEREPNADRAREIAQRRIARRELYLWGNPEPRTMVGRSRPTRNTTTVNAVYTPPKHRRQGLATSAVAMLSRALLDEGIAECVLYTDLDNPTSNRIYRRIGYEPVADAVRYRFR